MATQYVRLAKRLEKGIVADLDSGWSIAGLDVRQVPAKEDNPLAAKFVKKALADGRLEAASKAEWDEVHDTEAVEREAVEGRKRAGHVNSQEAHIQREAAKQNRKISESREGSGSKKSSKKKKNKRARAEEEPDDDDLDTTTDDDNDGDDENDDNTGE